MSLQPADEDTKMNAEAKSKETSFETKGFFRKAFRNVRSLLSRGYAKLPKNPLVNPIFSGSNKIGPKLQETDSSCKSSSQRWDPSEVVNKRDLLAQSSKSSTSASDQSRSEDLKEVKTRREESSFLAAENFAQKMEELEMMNVNDGNHALDIDEVVRCYSLLTSPAYLEIVDKFSKDVYQELSLAQTTRSDNNSMRRLDSATTHSSMRKLCSASIHNPTRNLGSASVHSSMRKMGCSTSVHTSMRKVRLENVHSSTKKLSSKRKSASDSIHGSIRKSGSDSLHGSMRKSCSVSVQGSMAKLGLDSIDGSMRRLGLDSIHGSMRKLSSDSIHGSMRKLGSDSIHGSMRKLSSDSIQGRKLSSESIHGSMRKMGSYSIHSSMSCMPSKALWS